MICDSLVTVILSAYLNTAADYSALYQGCVEPPFANTIWLSHPYWHDEEYRQADLCYEGRMYRNVKVRYNVFDNMLSVVSPDRKIPVVPDARKIDFFVQDGIFYVNRDGRFVCVEYLGEDVSLLHSRVKEKTTDVEKDGHFYHDFNTIDKYFLLYPDGRTVPVSGLRQVIKSNYEYKKKIKRFAKDNSLDFVKEKKLKSLVSCVRYLDAELINEGRKASVMPPHALTTMAAEDSMKVLSSFSSRTADVTIPQKVFDAISISDSIPAFYAFSPEGKAEYPIIEEFDDDENAGVGDLAPLRESVSLREVEVVGFMKRMAAGQSGMEAFRPALLRNMPLAMGESDVMKMAMMLPGVKTTGEASNGLNVRGGATDQNLMLYNNGTVFNPMHMFGLFSTFNTDMIADTELFKGGIPSQYGGRLSSVMNIKGRTASKEEWHGSASVGLLTAKANLEAPIVKDRVSLLLAGRGTYSDWMLTKIPEKSGYKNGNANFWDLGATLSASLSDSHSLNVYGYYSSDRFSFTRYDKYKYSNMNLSAEWKGQYGENLSSRLAVGYDHYDYSNDDCNSPYTAGRLSFNLNDYFLKTSLSCKIGEKNVLTGGLQSQLYRVMPGRYSPLGEESSVVSRQLDNDKALESALYVEDEMSVTDKLKVTGGVRFNMFNAMRKDKEKTYFAPELRLSSVYRCTENTSLKLGFNTMHQYIHKVSNSVVMSPTDSWILSNSLIKPQSGYQLSGGYYAESKNGVYEFSAEAYYKSMSNYLTYRSSAQLVMNSQLEKDVTTAKGRSYGIELQIRKLYGKLNGWVSYSYSRTQLRHDDASVATKINDGRWYSAEYDSPHELKFVGNYKFTRRVSVSLNLDYSTGRPYTVPQSHFYSSQTGSMHPYYSKRNSERMPDYFRTDFSFSIEPSHHLTNLTKSWFSIGVYNLLGRKNAYSIYCVSENNAIKAYKLSIFGAPIPFVSYNIKF